MPIVLRADGFVPAEVSAHELRMAVGRTLGWQDLRSTSFTVARTPTGYRFRGVGYGHGVGLCVIGAGHRAARGESAAQILRVGLWRVGPERRRCHHDAGGCAATPAPSVPVPVPPIAPAAVEVSDIRLALPAAEERDRAQLMGLLRRARAEIALAAGVPEVSTLTVTVHPSVESFGRATGQPWWIAASTVGHEIDLLPVGVLRQRGILESTLRHEVAHVVVDGELTSRRVWVREGAALYFANPAAPVLGESRVSCPADAELLRPVSAGAQREAYGRAERCFRRQLTRKSDWREVR